jgi:hypothetical protein
MTMTKFKVGQTVLWKTGKGSVTGKVVYISAAPVPFPIRVDFGGDVGLRYFKADGSRASDGKVCLFTVPNDMQP